MPIAEKVAARLPFTKQILERPFLCLTLILFFLILVEPLSDNRLLTNVVVQFVFLDVLMVGMASALRRGYVYLLMVLWLVGTLSSLAGFWWLGSGAARDTAQWLTAICYLAYLAGCMAGLIAYIVRCTKVTVESLFAAVSAYLLLAIVGAICYTMILVLDPQAFRGLDFQKIYSQGHQYLVMLYFSLVTQTTLGYGDIVPLSPFARIMAAVHALCGQLYLTVLVAWIVGLFVSSKMTRSNADGGPSCGDPSNRSAS